MNDERRIQVLEFDEGYVTMNKLPIEIGLIKSSLFIFSKTTACIFTTNHKLVIVHYNEGETSSRSFFLVNT